jgi:uracil phosphoribosyltransferase
MVPTDSASAAVARAEAFPNLHVSVHPLVQHKVTLLSDERTDTATFRQLLHELTQLLVYEATTDLPLQTVYYRTPLEPAVGHRNDSQIALVPILRAGLGMIDSARDLLPRTRVYHIGIYRDEVSHLPVSYYRRLPEQLPDDLFLLLDPMLATGGSVSTAATELKRHGARWIKYIGIIAAPEGVSRMLHDHPDIRVYVARLDRQLDDNAFIRPGLGDAGDRLFGTTDL